jgi:hypothetical protein
VSSRGLSSGLVLDFLRVSRRERFSDVKCFQKGGGAGKGALGICCCWSAIAIRAAVEVEV